MVAKPWENILNGLTFGLGLVTATAIFDYLSKMANTGGIPFQLGNNSPAGLKYPDRDDYYYTNYAYTQPIRDPPTEIDKIIFGNELYTPGFAYYAYDITQSLTQLPDEADRNTIPALPNPNGTA